MQQGTQAWFQARKHRLTGSNAGTALGLNPWKTPDALVRQMVRDYHDAEQEFVGNAATEYGRLHEPLAVMDYQSKTGNFVEECGFFVHPKYEWLGASPDGLVGDDTLVEIKCPFGLRNDNPPKFKGLSEQPHYYAQVQIELACADRTTCHFYQWAQHGDSLEIIERDDVWLDQHIPALRAFYKHYYLTEIENPAHLEPLVKEVNTLVALSLIEEYDALSATIDDATARKKEVLAELVRISKERDAVIHGRKLTKVERKGNVQYSKIPALKGLDLEPFRGKSSEHWRLS
jgi:putative phage-type endonuclease